MLSRSRSLMLLAALVAVLAMVVAGCGSDDDESSGGASTATQAAASEESAGGAGVEESTQSAEAAFEVPTEIPVTTKLEAKPEKKTVAWIEPQIPAGKSQTAGFQNAADAIGWDLKIIPTDPFKPAGAVQQAIDEKVDFIFMTAAATALFPEQLAAAKKAGIPVLSCFGTDVPNGDGLIAQCGDATAARNDGALLADWAISDSGGKANILSVNIPDYPILVAQEEGFTERVESNCPDCKVTKLGVTVDDLAKGAIPQAIASKLQADPSIDYVFFTMSDLPTGVKDTLDGAGLGDQAKLFGLDFNEARLQELESGTYEVALGLPKEYAAWLLFQFAAEYAENGEIVSDERALADTPRILVGAEQAPQYLDTRFQWPGPEGFQEQFKELWNVG